MTKEKPALGGFLGRVYLTDKRPVSIRPDGCILADVETGMKLPDPVGGRICLKMTVHYANSLTREKKLIDGLIVLTACGLDMFRRFTQKPKSKNCWPKLTACSSLT